VTPVLTVWPWGLALALGLTTAAWLLSLWRRDAGVIDGFWGVGFALLAWVYWSAGGAEPSRGLLVAALATVWGVRLSVHIVRRNHGREEDWRYRAMRERRGARFPLWSLVMVFWLQGALMWLLSAPLLQAQAQAPFPRTLDIAGVTVWLVGFLFETIGDAQLSRFRADPANQGRVLRTGLWRWTRHPNYFGDALVWWGLFLIAVATPSGWWTIFSPLLMTWLLLRVSGVSLLEEKLVETRPGYREYVESTSAFIPWPPRRHRQAGH